MPFFWIFLGLLFATLVVILIHDVTQRRHAILHNFPLIGHFRYLLEKIGPELRQYIVTDNDEERPFSRDQRTWVYASSNRENNYFAFGTDNDLELTPNYLIIKHAAFPLPHHPPETAPIPCAKILGAWRQRRKAFRPASVVNVSAMSYGSLGAAAVKAINTGCKIAGALHNTGEGGVSDHHRLGGDLVFQIGTAYFGCQEGGRFSLPRLRELIDATPQIRAIEIKMSQGAKPGLGGLLPKEKITAEIARIRGISRDADCVSPSGHSAFHNADSLLDFIELLAEETGLPVGIKSAVGEQAFWADLAGLVERTGRAPDFITVDGGEGGTGASPLVYADHVALPFKLGLPRVIGEFTRRGIHDRIVFAGSGKLGFPEQALLAFAMGCDLIAVAREAMLSIGCIQAQRCQSGICPAGVATNHPWLMAGLDPQLKSVRLANYLITLRTEILKLCHSCGVPHPSLITPDHMEILDGQLRARSLADALGTVENNFPRPTESDLALAAALMSGHQ
ncbi:MAG: glutamate synthase-related protein [Verrucomicrobiales bacterium]